MTRKLPVDYTKLTRVERREVREQYVREQRGLCYFCNSKLDEPPSKKMTDLKIDWGLFPPGFLNAPVHLQHCHVTGMTEGAVHAYCNAVMWQYYGR